MAARTAGEPFHVDAVRSILRKIGLNASALQCGAHLPYDEAAANALRRAGREPTALHNNCSGKARRNPGAVQGRRRRSGHLSARRAIRRSGAFSSSARASPTTIAATWPLGIDGCGIPVYATSLSNGRAFVRALGVARRHRSTATPRRFASCAMRWSRIPIRCRHGPVRYRADASRRGGNIVVEGGRRRRARRRGDRAGIRLRLQSSRRRLARARGPSTDRRAASRSACSTAQAGELARFARAERV